MRNIFAQKSSFYFNDLEVHRVECQLSQLCGTTFSLQKSTSGRNEKALKLFREILIVWLLI